MRVRLFRIEIDEWTVEAQNGREQIIVDGLQHAIFIRCETHVFHDHVEIVGFFTSTRKQGERRDLERRTFVDRREPYNSLLLRGDSWRREDQFGLDSRDWCRYSSAFVVH